MIIIGEKYSDILKNPLEKLGFEVKLLPKNPDVAGNLSGHADLSLFYDGAGEIWAAEYLKGSELAEKLSSMEYRIHFCTKPQGSVYPADVQLNLRVAGNSFFYNPATAECAIAEHLMHDLGKKPIPVKQGYTACSTLYFAENAIITADRGILTAGLVNGYDVLYISEGYIQLPGYDHGFIGGCAFPAGDGRIAFTGSLTLHPDREKILAFLAKYAAEPVFLTDFPVFDIGGAIIV